MHHLTKFREDRPNHSGDMADFRFLRWRPSAIWDFQKLKILTFDTVRRPNVCHRAKFCEDRLNRFRDMAYFRFFKMAAVRHLDLFYACLDHPQRVFGGLCDCKI